MQSCATFVLSEHNGDSREGGQLDMCEDIQLHEKQIQAQLKGALLWNINGNAKWTMSKYNGG